VTSDYGESSATFGTGCKQTSGTHHLHSPASGTRCQSGRATRPEHVGSEAGPVLGRFEIPNRVVRERRDIAVGVELACPLPGRVTDSRYRAPEASIGECHHSSGTTIRITSSWKVSAIFCDLVLPP
jgi:hypothetical protein